MEQRLTLKLAQKLVLTPSLQQAIKLLQLSKLELVQHIRQELLENPVLEELLDESVEPEPQEPGDLQADEAESPGETAAAEVPESSPYDVDLDWASGYDDAAPREAVDTSRDDEGPWYENVLSTRESLQDYLSWQLHLTLDDDADLAVGEEIIGNIDDDGYLRASVSEIAGALSETEERVERVLSVVQYFDPPGVGARTVQECLQIQLSQLPGRDTAAETIVSEQMGSLENRNLPQIARALRLPLEQVHRAAQVIAGLEPKPGRLFASEEPQYVIPDLFIFKLDDEYHVSLNDEGLPKLRVNSYYRRLLRNDDLPPATREYIQKKFSSALWLLKSIHQRQKTIYRVAESIVRHQRDFFDYGISRLRPMILRDVADDIGVHESTVSRVTTRKFAQTPQGLFELKFFFNTGIEKDAGPSMASASVQEIIRTMVAEEDAAAPLSDEGIAARLRGEHGLIIARRTVAKYRTLLKILPASKRKRIASFRTP